MDLNGGMWGKRGGSNSSSGGSHRDLRDSSDGVPYSELLPLFKKRQLAHALDEERRRGSGHESGLAPVLATHPCSFQTFQRGPDMQGCVNWVLHP